MLQLHATALSRKIASYHEFLERFSKTKKVVYGFVEGKEDFCFYRGFVEHFIPGDWEIELWPAGNRDQVLQIHRDIDWRRFPKKRVGFFIDRDLSDLLPEKLPSDINIYVTDKYSIENSVANRGTCRRILTEVFGFSNVNHQEMDQVCDQFEKELEKFFVTMIPTMAHILYWRRSVSKANLNDINIGKMFSVKGGFLVIKRTLAAKTARTKYIHKSAGVAFDSTTNVSNELKDFGKVFAYRNFVRGKYIMWFLIEFCRSIHQAASSSFTACAGPPKMKVSISAANAVTIIGNRARVPKSLRAFLLKTFCAYIKQKEA